ncbi:MAG: NAD(P)-dependent oxidoreductase, partial [Marinilabiliales bacterium]
NKAIEEFGKDQVVGTARTPKNVKNLDINIFQADYNDKEGFLKAFKGIDAVVLISSMSDPKDRISQHRNVIHAAKECGVKKIVYTSIIGKPGDSTFDAIINSNRQTEEDIKNSGLNFAIGRNGLYIEPDIEYLDNYIKDCKIINSAGDGKCSYTSRGELANAYISLIKNDSLNGKTYNLVGESITQTELVGLFNKFFSTELIYKSITPKKYLAWQQKHNGEFLGSVIAGIYKKIKNNEFNVESDYVKVTGREHKQFSEIFKEFKN